MSANVGNKRIQVFDNNGTFKSQISNSGTPWAICVPPERTNICIVRIRIRKILWTTVEIYKMEWMELSW